MRLLNTYTLKLREFAAKKAPLYAILSHTWEEEEVTFQDIQHLPTARKRKGFDKVQKCCEQAIRDGFGWVWIDTCCIDKSSSTELSEAINSMFQWYKNSTVCYAYLTDVKYQFPDIDEFEFKNCRWFTRGWTLQELIAPLTIEFYASDWSEIGTKLTLEDWIASRTGIPPHILLSDSPSSCTVAQRMSWASDRVTTRVEDMAYCLLGIFNVNIPLLYGEGDRAFIRLQEEICEKRRITRSFSGPSPCWRNFQPTAGSRPAVHFPSLRANSRGQGLGSYRPGPKEIYTTTMTTSPTYHPRPRISRSKNANCPLQRPIWSLLTLHNGLVVVCT